MLNCLIEQDCFYRAMLAWQGGQDRASFPAGQTWFWWLRGEYRWAQDWGGLPTNTNSTAGVCVTSVWIPPFLSCQSEQGSADEDEEMQHWYRWRVTVAKSLGKPGRAHRQLIGVCVCFCFVFLMVGKRGQLLTNALYFYMLWVVGSSKMGLDSPG